MKPLTKLAIVIYSGFLLNSCSNPPATNAESPEKIKAQIESILKIQEDIYNGSHSAAELKKMAATCEDSMIFLLNVNLSISTRCYIVFKTNATKKIGEPGPDLIAIKLTE